MKHTYAINFGSLTTVHSKRAIRELATKFPELTFDFAAQYSSSKDEHASRAAFQEAKARGLKCSFEVQTRYEYEDALSGDLGILGLGPAGTAHFRAVLPMDAFDFSTGCPRCGLGAAQTKPRIISERSIRCKANFYYCDLGSGGQGASQILMRAEIGHEIIEATGQPWCMRHPITRSGSIVEKWMEPVACAAMPPLSPKSEGVLFGSTTALESTGEPPVVVNPCPVCGRTIWDYDREQHTRLIYPRAAAEAAQKHAVLAMYEPWVCFPSFDPVKRTFKHLYGLPWLLFSRKAIEVLLKYVRYSHSAEDIRDSAFIQPVFSE